MRPVTRNAYAHQAADEQMVAVAWQDPESLHTVEPGTFESWLSYPRLRRTARVAVRFIDAHTGMQYEGSDGDVFGYRWIDEHGHAQLTYRYGSEPSWAKCGGSLILNDEGDGGWRCRNDDTPEGCRGSNAIHSGAPTPQVDE